MTPASPGPALISLYYCLLTFLLSPATTRHLPQNRRSSPSPPPAPCAGRQPAGEGRRRADPFPSLPPRDLFLLSPVLGPTTTTTVINKSAGRQAGTRRRRAFPARRKGRTASGPRAPRRSTTSCWWAGSSPLSACSSPGSRLTSKVAPSLPFFTSSTS
ncbi:hypothetical protein BDA96_09G058700 [Sorghum bicolor]|uniref:Uncharacterized protein n=1 Tax=Sorghum bicolor TaxID=4558 RepID=A0A921U369_SORBI|nr:hypothetical protein BDA96_09G058700 [Sorghum bicolor]